MTNSIKWSIDQAHSHISFKVRHFLVSHIRGEVTIFDASIYMVGNDFTTAEINFWLDANSVLTGNPARDRDLKTMDFLDVVNHKQITFVGKSIEPRKKQGAYKVWGVLTMVGISKNVSFDVDFEGILKNPIGNARVSLSISGAFNRSDWGLIWSTGMEATSVMVGEKISVTGNIELTNVGYKDLVMELAPNQLIPHDFLPFNPTYNHETIRK